MSFFQDVPDVAKEQLKFSLPIDLVGLQDVRIPIRLDAKTGASARISLLVSLDSKKTRGIHMSRLYLILHDYFSKNKVRLSGLKQVLTSAIKSQRGQSGSGRLCLKAGWPVLRKALKSSLSGWREYPVYFEVNYLEKSRSFQYIVGGEVLYSSTCPCSASLSRQIIKKDFEKKFSKKKSFKKSSVLDYFSDPRFLTATPHAQKSSALFKLQISDKIKDSFSFKKIVDEIEKTLGTAVQMAVKREDEAEFARQNAINQMFCEDAARRVALLFKNKKSILDFSVRIRHYESLHPFTVESSIVKGIPGGWRA